MPSLMLKHKCACTNVIQRYTIFLVGTGIFFMFKAFSKVITMAMQVQSGFSTSVRNSIQTNLTKKKTQRRKRQGVGRERKEVDVLAHLSEKYRSTIRGVGVTGGPAYQSEFSSPFTIPQSVSMWWTSSQAGSLFMLDNMTNSTSSVPRSLHSSQF